MKIDIVQFTPVPGGETTWTKATAQILIDLGYEVRVLHPTKSGKKLGGFMEMPNQHFIKQAKLPEELQQADIIYFVNSIHLEASKKKSAEEKAAMFDAVRPIFEGLHNKKIIIHEHGNMYSIKLYRYDAIFEILQNNGNRVVMTTNLHSSVPRYEEMGIPAFLTRQPFYPTMYPEITKNKTKTPTITFNSRYTATKRPQLFLKYMDPFFETVDNFKIRFKGNKNDNVTIWYKLQKYFEYPQISIQKNNPDMRQEVFEIYDGADYCAYPGLSLINEKGRVEYSMMEAWYYGLPLLVSPEVIEKFNLQEFGYTQEMLNNGMVLMTERNLDKIVNGKFTKAEKEKIAEGGRELLKEFLPETFIPRFQKALDYLNSNKKFVKKEAVTLF